MSNGMGSSGCRACHGMEKCFCRKAPEREQNRSVENCATSDTERELRTKLDFMESYVVGNPENIMDPAPSRAARYALPPMPFSSDPSVSSNSDYSRGFGDARFFWTQELAKFYGKAAVILNLANERIAELEAEIARLRSR